MVAGHNCESTAENGEGKAVLLHHDAAGTVSHKPHTAKSRRFLLRGIAGYCGGWRGIAGVLQASLKPSLFDLLWELDGSATTSINMGRRGGTKRPVARLELCVPLGAQASPISQSKEGVQSHAWGPETGAECRAQSDPDRAS